MAVQYLDSGNDDGTCLGQSSSEKISFYGASPTTRPRITAVATATATTTLNERKIDRLYTALRTLGLISTAAS